MNKEKEFEEKILNKLLVDLKDIDKYKSFKNGSFIYDLGYYQGNLLVNEIERLNNIIKNLDKMFEYYFIGNKKYDENTVNTIYIKYIKLKELKDSE